MTVLISGCNKDSDSFVAEGDFGNCSVTAFSIAKDDSVLAKLDSVYFSIDLVNAVIFNADSLPKGTRTDKLIVKISTASASACDLTFRDPKAKRDTTISFISNPNDSINFADGPVKLSITSYDGLKKRDYTIKVNVHQVEPDTLYWDKASSRNLPGKLSNPAEQKTVEFDGKVYCMTASDNAASLAVCENPYNNDWTISDASLPADARLSTLTASSDALYMLDSHGNLYKSADALTWAATGEHMDWLYGGYDDKVLGARKDADGWKHVSYPSGAVTAVPAGCPVSGTGQMIVYETKWSATPLALFVGGRDASGLLVGSTWGYDGTTWAKISSRDIDERENVSLFPYFTPRVNKNNWRVTERSVLIAVGGNYESGEGPVVSNTVYVSYDQGITWEEASSYLQLPDYIRPFTSAQAIVRNTTLDESMSRSASADGWMPLSGTRLPAWATPVPFAKTSRVSQAVTEWECPYIYLFGGTDAAGKLNDTVWKGVIRRFTFRPLY